MFGNSHFDRTRQDFADQFSRDSHGFIYRKNQKGAPIHVSDVERDLFVATFNRRLRYTIWSIFPATITLILLLVWLIPDVNGPAVNIAVVVGIVAITVPFLAIIYWAWNAPSREFQSRAPEGVALTRNEARELTFSKITYSQLALAAVMGVGLVWKMSAKTDVFHGLGMGWLVFGSLIIAVAGIQAIRKWRFSQQGSIEQD